MFRYALFAVALAMPCKKKDVPTEPDPMPTEGAKGYSVTKVKDPELDGGAGSGSGAGRLEAAGGVGGSGGPTDAGVDAERYGGNGAAPYIDDEGHLHGPGGPIFMGRGVECNAERDHCMRDGVWFAVQNLVAGKLYRAVPVFEYEGKWYNWRGKPEEFSQRFKTKVGTRDKIHVGDPIIWFIDENASKKFVDNEYDALTSSRWEAGVVESIAVDKIRVKGWTYGAVPIDTTRIIVEKK
jgi:hypothetical protein